MLKIKAHVRFDIAVPGQGGMAVSRPDPMIFSDASKAAHDENIK